MPDPAFHVGFTGTRQGLTAVQRDLLASALDGLAKQPAVVAHHGDCVGADAEFHEMALERGLYIVVHPPEVTKFRAFCEGAAEVLPPLSYLARDRAIVNRSDLVIGCPRSARSRTGGTWYTLRYASERGIACTTLLADGTVLMDDPVSAS